MRSAVAAALLLVGLLTLPTVAGFAQHEPYETASPDEAATSAPLLTVLAAVPRVVSLATSEASYDGTPDAARTLAVQLLAYTRGFDGAATWANVSQDDLLVAREAASLAATVPRDAGLLARNRARCESWDTNATIEEYSLWNLELEPAVVGLTATADGLKALAPRAPTGDVDAAADTLEAWLEDESTRAVTCMDTLRNQLGVVDNGAVYVNATPTDTWPAGVVYVRGGTVATGVTSVHLAAPSLGLDAVAPLGGRGSFLHRFEVPADVALGNHTITATAGDRSATTGITVGQAPVELYLAHAAVARPGGTWSLTVSILPPSGLQAATHGQNVTVHLDENVTLTLPSGAGTITFPVPDDATRLAGTVTFHGSDRLQPATASFSVPATSVVLTDAGATDATVSLPWWTYTAAGVAVLGVLLAVRHLRQGHDARAVTAAAVAARPRPPTGFAGGTVAVFAAVRGWLVRLGLVPKAATAREACQHVGDLGVSSDRVVQAFEEHRYGERPEREDDRRAVVSWATRLSRRILGGRDA